MKKKVLTIIAIAGCLAFWAAIGQTEEKNYPDRQINFIIPYDPGGSIDIQARVYVEALKEILKVSVIPDNKPGAGGALGMTGAPGECAAVWRRSRCESPVPAFAVPPRTPPARTCPPQPG